jgi:hypothetical protein
MIPGERLTDFGPTLTQKSFTMAGLSSKFDKTYEDKSVAKLAE